MPSQKTTAPLPKAIDDEKMKETRDAARHLSTPEGKDEFEKETIALALAGAADEGRYLLDACARGLVSGALSERMRFYLSARLREVLDGVGPAIALCVARSDGRPREQFPAWERPLGAFAAICVKREFYPEDTIALMSEARQLIEGKPLARTQAHRIRKTYEPMQSMTMGRLFAEMIGRHRRDGEQLSRPVVLSLLELVSRKNLLNLRDDKHLRALANRTRTRKKRAS